MKTTTDTRLRSGISRKEEGCAQNGNFVRISLALAVLAAPGWLPGAYASTIYSNDFETPATAFAGLTAGGTLSSLSTVTLPTDGAGLSSPNQSTWLGALGLNINKSTNTPETVTLALSGLNPGSQYSVAFDLLIGGSWDGSAGGYGPDEWALQANSGANSATLVDATFSNCGVYNQLCGAGSPQTYSDATPLGGLSGTTFAPTTGADYASDTNGNYGQDYAVYAFSQGLGNPVLTFMAGASTATLTFERISGSGDSADEYWAIDNLAVSGSDSSAPEPATTVLLGGAIAILGLHRWKGRPAC